MIVLRRFVRDRRRSATWWSVGIVGLVLMTTAFYPSIKGQPSFDELVKGLPPAMRSMVGLEEGVSLSSAPGYLNARLFSTLLPLLLLIFGIGLGARAIGGSEDDGTLELLLANPVTRRRVLAERYAAVVALVVAASLVFVASLYVLGSPFGLLRGVATMHLLGACAGALCLTLLHTTLAFAAGSAIGGRARASAVATVIAVSGYLIHTVLGTSDALRSLRIVSPWNWYLGRNALVQGIQARAIMLPLVLSAALVMLGATAFVRRDLRSP